MVLKWGRVSLWIICNFKPTVGRILLPLLPIEIVVCCQVEWILCHSARQKILRCSLWNETKHIYNVHHSIPAILKTSFQSGDFAANHQLGLPSGWRQPDHVKLKKSELATHLAVTLACQATNTSVFSSLCFQRFVLECQRAVEQKFRLRLGMPGCLSWTACAIPRYICKETV